MHCEEVRERFADYLTGTAGPPAGDALEHLSACARCGAEFVELSDLWNDLGELDTPRPDSVSLRRSFDVALTTPAAERRGVSSLLRWKASARVVRAVFATAAGLAVAVALWQASVALRNGVIGGVAQEVDGAPISGVTIKVANAAGSQRMTVTRADGTWEFRDVPVGTYSVTADLTGFQTARYSNVTVAGDDALRLPFKLQGGAVSTAIELSLNGEVPSQLASAKRAEEREWVEDVKDKVETASVGMLGGWTAYAPLSAGAPGSPEVKKAMVSRAGAAEAGEGQAQEQSWQARLRGDRVQSPDVTMLAETLAEKAELYELEARQRRAAKPVSPAGSGQQGRGNTFTLLPPSPTLSSGSPSSGGLGRNLDQPMPFRSPALQAGLGAQSVVGGAPGGGGGGGRGGASAIPQTASGANSYATNDGGSLRAGTREFDYYGHSSSMSFMKSEVDREAAPPPPPAALKADSTIASATTGRYGNYSTPDGVVLYSRSSPLLPPQSSMAAAMPVPSLPAPPVTIVGVPGASSKASAVMSIDEDGPWERRVIARNLELDIPFTPVSPQPLATFASDVDTAAYANVRRYLASGQWPPRSAVRIEEFINYFHYDYPQGSSDRPITASMEAASAPWNPDHRLIRVGIKAREVRMDRKPVNLVFLVDVSGSMNQPAKLPLLKSSLRMLVDRLGENDTVTIVTYADSSGIALPPTNGSRKDVLLRAIDNLSAAGSTNGGAGIQTAYAAAVANFVRGGVNRVILATDGDFNVGIVNTGELIRLIEDKARTGVFLSVLGFGSDNLKDGMMEQLADHGNGNYAYIDTLNEGRKVLIDEMAGTLVTVAKDVKIQVEFNPAEAIAYRLIGYENRALADADFANDGKDAGDMGSGQTVTALFEVIPRGVTAKDPAGEPLRFQPSAAAPVAADRKTNGPNELLNLKVRYKDPDGATSKSVELLLVDRGQAFSKASADFRFAAAVASFGMALRTGNSNLNSTLEIAQGSRGNDRSGQREEFIQMVERAKTLFGWGRPVG